ncbi:response regulator [Geobacter sp.]|uniref:response regulator n=1 Tax=Geobacter sp. TaxID=46610 RepID=UPI0026282965|nr:response regulator [Geobacter sp.]
MKILIADDDGVARAMLDSALRSWGYETAVASDGDEAWRLMEGEDPPRMALLDWMMPGLSGMDICRKLRASSVPSPPYLILITAKGGKENIVAGLDGGANDYIVKPFVMDELRARVGVGQRYLGMQDALARRMTELNELNRKLEQRVRERTFELESANRELEAFGYSVSHDLRAPLRHIVGFGEMLAEQFGPVLGEEGLALVGKIRDSGRHMTQLVDDLLELSIVSRREMDCREIDMTGLCHGIVRELLENEPGRNVTFTIAPALTARADRRLLRIVLQNLLGNAWKYTSRKESATIEVGVTPFPDERAFYVRDDGAGFDMEFAGKLFGAFQRLHSTAEFPGTGIGLATVHRIVSRHGGRVWAEGEPGKGATFFFTVP